MQEPKPTPLTIPLSWIYGGAALLYHGAFDRGIRKPVDIGRPVISVGNLVTGGTGKTPVVMALAQAIVERDLMPAILTRGYGGSRTGILRDRRWESGESAGAEAGDEPVLLSRMLPGVTIGVGKDRARLGRHILAQQPVDLFLLDDGFQHRRVHRQANVLLLDAERPFDNGHLLPAGHLREPLSAIERATAILLTGANGSVPDTARNLLGAFDGRIWTSRTCLDRFETLQGDVCDPPQRPVLAVGGIARPDRLYRFCQQHDLDLIGLKSFPDHYRYREADVRELEIMSPGAVLLTTAKDAVRLAPLVTHHAKWCVATIRIDIDGGWGSFLERIVPEVLRPEKGEERPG